MANVTWIKIRHSRKYGGGNYAEKVRQALVGHVDFENREIVSKDNIPRYLKPLDWFLKIAGIKGHSNVWIMDSFIVVAFSNFSKMTGKKVILLHHIDHSVFPVIIRPVSYFLEKVFHSKAKKADMVVVVSGYWKEYLTMKGYKNIKVIYNSFEVKNFHVTSEEISQFRDGYGFDGRPIVYIGNSLKAKGVIETYHALKSLGINLVTSGEKTVDIPVKNLNVDYRDYVTLLKASSIVVTMSKFKEGWCGTAHEAMLCKTPVIGSGLGGMKELLEGGKQIVCPNFKDLRGHVEHLLSSQDVRLRMGESGFEYAKNFTMEKFSKEWLELIENIL